MYIDLTHYLVTEVRSTLILISENFLYISLAGRFVHLEPRHFTERVSESGVHLERKKSCYETCNFSLLQNDCAQVALVLNTLY